MKTNPMRNSSIVSKTCTCKMIFHPAFYVVYGLHRRVCPKFYYRVRLARMTDCIRV